MAVNIQADLFVRNVVTSSLAQKKLDKISSAAKSGASKVGDSALVRQIRNLEVSLAGVENALVGVNNNFNKLESTQRRAASQLNKTRRNTQEATNAITDFSDKSALALRRFTAFTFAAGGVFGTLRNVTSGLKEAISFERELVRVAQVSDTSLKRVQQGLGQSISKLSQEFSASSSELNRVALIFAQAQGSLQGVDKAVAAIAKSNLAATFESMEATAQGSLAAFRQFQLETYQLEEAIASVNEVSAKFAVESGDLFRAIQKAGGVFSQASQGLNAPIDNLKEFLAIFTAVRATTRESADTIATGLRTIFTRLQRPGTITFLKDFGIDVTDTQGKFIGITNAIKEINDGLDQLDARSLRRAEVLETLTGFRQIGKGTALFSDLGIENIDEAIKATKNLGNAFNEDVGQAQQTLETRFIATGERLLALFRKISESASFQGIADALLIASNAMISLGEATADVIPLLATIATFKLATSLIGGGGARAFGTRLFTGRQGFNQGGEVGGVGSGDRQLILAEAGEFVLRKNAVNKLGLGFVSKLNNIDKFANGGLIGGLPRFQDGGEVPLASNPEFRGVAEFYVKQAQQYGVSLEKATRDVNKLAKTSIKLSEAQVELGRLLRQARVDQLSTPPSRGGGTNSGSLNLPFTASSVERSRKLERDAELIQRERENIQQTEKSTLRQQKRARKAESNASRRNQKFSTNEIAALGRKSEVRQAEIDRQKAIINQRRALNASISGPGAGIRRAETNAGIALQLNRIDRTDFTSIQEDTVAQNRRNALIDARQSQAIAQGARNERRSRGGLVPSNNPALGLVRDDPLAIRRLTPEQINRRRAARIAGRAATFRRSINPFAGGGASISRGVRGLGQGLVGTGAIAPALIAQNFDRQSAQSGAIGGAFGGASAGAFLGGSIGSIVPGVGTVAGGLIGAGIGAVGGAISGRDEGRRNEAEKNLTKTVDRLNASLENFNTTLSQTDLTKVLREGTNVERNVRTAQGLRGGGFFSSLVGLFDEDAAASIRKNSQAGNSTFDFVKLAFGSQKAGLKILSNTSALSDQNRREIADQNKPVAAAAEKFLTQEVEKRLRAGQSLDGISSGAINALSSDNADVINNAKLRAKAAQDEYKAIIATVQARLDEEKNIIQFNSILDRLSEGAERSANILSLFDQRVAGQNIQVSNIVARADGNFQDQVGGRFNAFNNLEVLSTNQINAAANRLEGDTGVQFSDRRRGLLLAGNTLQGLRGQLRDVTTTGDIASNEDAATVFRGRATQLIEGSGLDREIGENFLEILRKVDSQAIQQFRKTGELPAVFDELKKSVGENSQAFAALQERQNAFADLIAQRTNEFAGLISSRNQLIGNQATAAAGAARTRAGLFGQTFSVGAGVRNDLAGVIAKTGTADPLTIQQRINDNNEALRGGGLSPGERGELLGENNTLVQALKELSQGIAGLSDIQNRLAEIESKRQAQRSQALDIAFGGPEAARAQVRGLAAFQAEFQGGLGGAARAGFSQSDVQRGFELTAAQRTPEERDKLEAQFLSRLGFGGLAGQTRGGSREEQQLRGQFDQEAKRQQDSFEVLRKINEDGIRSFEEAVERNFKANVETLNKAAEALAKIPEKVTVEATHDFNINLDSLNFLTNLEPTIKRIAQETVNRALKIQSEGRVNVPPNSRDSLLA